MEYKPEIIIDRDIPFIKGRTEAWSHPRYLAGREITRHRLGDAVGLLIRTYTHCDASLLEGSEIRFIATATIGTDHIDLDYCRSRGITICNSPGCNAPGVAQYVWSSIAALGIDPKGMKVGVVGKGNVGGIVTEWGRRMGSEVLVCDPPREADGLADEQYVTLEEILGKSDIVTLHTPLTRQGEWPTYHMIGRRELSLMRKGTILINASRGGVVDSEALRDALQKGDIRAVIDTWEGEPDIDPTLLKLPEIATFHIAGYSYEGKQRATRMVLEAAGRYFGVSPDTSGLEGTYTAPEKLSPDRILASYDPRRDMAALKGNPKDFLKLRDNYNFRHEVK